MSKIGARAFLLAAPIFFFIGCAKEPARHASEPIVDAHANVVADASTPTSTNDAGSVESAPREILRIGSTDPTRNAFEVDGNGGTWIDLVKDEEPHRRRCDLRGEVIGVSARGRVVLQDSPSYALTIVDLSKSCEAAKISLESNSQTERWNGSSSTNALSDDGSRIAIGRDDVGDTTNIYELPSGKKLFDCTTHSPAGGPSTRDGISGDGRGVIWTHGREGTWLEDLGKCSDDRTADVASSTSDAALVSPHRKFLVACPFHDWGTDQPHLGFRSQSIDKTSVIGDFVGNAFAKDDFDFCDDHASAFSPDDTRLAFEDGERVRIFSLVRHAEPMQIGETTLRDALAGSVDSHFSRTTNVAFVNAIAFSTNGNALLVASHARIAVFDLTAYAAYQRAKVTTGDDERALASRAVLTLDIDEPN